MTLLNAETYECELLHLRLELSFAKLFRLIAAEDTRGAYEHLVALGPYAMPLLVKLSYTVSQQVLEGLVCTLKVGLLVDTPPASCTEALIKTATAELRGLTP